MQPLVPPLARALGTERGLIVAWVDPHGPASDRLRTGEVIVAVNGERLDSIDQWRAGAGRAAAGDQVVLRVRARDGALREEPVAAVPFADAPQQGVLGLSVRRAPEGLQVTAVAPDSSAARAGILPGDLITLAGSHDAPTPRQLAAAFAEAQADRPLLVAVTRGGDHLVAALLKE